MTDLIKILVTR